MRNVPVRLAGNVIQLPGRELFVTEACSGLRSLTALISMGVLLGALVLKKPVTRVALLLLAVPVAIVVNGIRVFLTGFLVYYVSPAYGEGFMHITEGWLLFLVSLSILAGMAWIGGLAERLGGSSRRRSPSMRSPSDGLGWRAFVPTFILLVGCGFVWQTHSQRAMPLAAPLSSIIPSLDGYTVADLHIGDERASHRRHVRLRRPRVPARFGAGVPDARVVLRPSGPRQHHPLAAKLPPRGRLGSAPRRRLERSSWTAHHTT